MYPVFGQLPYLRTLTGVRFIGATSQPTLLENAEIMRALVPICPNLRRINWFRGNQFDMDSIVAIEHNGSHVTWYVLRAWEEKVVLIQVGERFVTEALNWIASLF
jgi:hypothetical protein